jgi:hypothetical protein
VQSTAAQSAAEGKTVMKKFYYVLVMVVILAACSENNVNNNPNNNTNNPEICSDNIDNDLDGLIDCHDSDCANNQACTTTPNCGNGLIDPDEECDGPDLNGASCESLQLGTGTLTCNECAYDTRGCGNNALKIYQSGTRMKMRVGTSLDGAKEFKGWYDSQLGINCVFRKLATGQTRCIPELTSLNDRWYSDNNCTARAAVFHADNEDLTVSSIISMEVREGMFQVSRITGKIVIGIYSIDANGACVRWSNTPPSFDIYGLAPESDLGYQIQEITNEP